MMAWFNGTQSCQRRVANYFGGQRAGHSELLTHLWCLYRKMKFIVVAFVEILVIDRAEEPSDLP
jgi:hypothetical protein